MKRNYEKKKAYLVLNKSELKKIRKLVNYKDFSSIPIGYSEETIKSTLYGKSNNPIVLRWAIGIFKNKLNQYEKFYLGLIEKIRYNKE